MGARQFNRWLTPIEPNQRRLPAALTGAPMRKITILIAIGAIRSPGNAFDPDAFEPGPGEPGQIREISAVRPFAERGLRGRIGRCACRAHFRADLVVARPDAGTDPRDQVPRLHP